MENAACHFVFYNGPRKGEAQQFDTARIAVGRGGNCDFRLEAYHVDQVGNNHAEVLLEENKAYVLYDLGIRSGTFVNGERVHDRCTLMHEDYIRFGEEGPEVIFRVGPALPGKQPLPQIFPVTAELEFFSGSDAGRIFPINAGVISNIGRRADLEVPLDPRGDMIVSGNHCNIRYVNGHFVLSDTSRNGTYVNGDLIELQPIEILDGDVIMLGDGGPQARFHVDPAKRHYPNHRILSRVAKPETPKETSAFSAAPMASAKPYSSGSQNVLPPTPPTEDEAPPEPEVPEAAEHAQELPGMPAIEEPLDPADAAAFEETPDDTTESDPPAEHPGQGDMLTAADSFDDAPQPDTESFTEADPEHPQSNDVYHDEGEPTPVDPAPVAPAAATPAKPKFQVPEIKLPPDLLTKLKANKKPLVIAGAALVAIVAISLMLSGGDDAEVASTPARTGQYNEAVADLAAVENTQGRFQVQIPTGWTTLNQGAVVSTESPDKQLALDYARMPGLTEAGIRHHLGRNGAVVADEAQNLNIGGQQIKLYQASAGNVRRVAAVQHLDDTPLLAVLETEASALEKLDSQTLNKLLVTNVEAEVIPAAPAPAPETQTPAPETASPSTDLPTPATDATETAAPAPDTPAPEADTTASATPATAPEADSEQTSPSEDLAAGPRISSESLGLALNAPEGWTGTSEEDDEMILVSDGAGLEIRIARDPGQLDAEATFEAMVAEEWVKDGDMIDAKFQAGEFARDDQNLMLVLIPEAKNTTIIIYATATEDFTQDQRVGISTVIRQLIP